MNRSLLSASVGHHSAAAARRTVSFGRLALGYLGRKALQAGGAGRRVAYRGCVALARRLRPTARDRVSG